MNETVLKTEQSNPASAHLDEMTAEEMVLLMQKENLYAVQAIAPECGTIAAVIDAAAERMKKGGRLFYFGCGTSGRLGVLDASECVPTFGVSPDTVIGVISGGDRALRYSSEAAEDDDAAGRRDLSAFDVSKNDTVIGISAAGGAAYVCGALLCAKEHGALCVALTCNAGSPIESIADFAIHPDTGAEVVTGSTRMKAGSAHKMILNMISTGVMVKLGHVYGNRMIHLKPSNAKLKQRILRMVCEMTSCDADAAESALSACDWDIRAAVDRINNRT